MADDAYTHSLTHLLTSRPPSATIPAVCVPRASELIVHENAQVMSIGDGLARADEAGEQASLALEKLEELISETTKIGMLLVEPAKMTCFWLLRAPPSQGDFAG